MTVSKRGKCALFALCLSFVCAASEPAAAIAQLIQDRQFTEARAALKDALKNNAGSAELWNLLGVMKAQENDNLGAEAAFLKAVQFEPGLGGGWLNLGHLYVLRAGNGDKQAESKAIAAYRKVLHLDPRNAEAHHQMALLFQWRGEFRESIAHLNRLPAEDQSKRPAMVLRCAAEGALGNSEAALALAGHLLADPGLEEDDVAAILPVLEARSDAVALRLIEGLDSRGLASARTLPRLAALYERRGKLPEARRVFDRIFHKSPPSAGTLLDLARIAWKQQDYEGALGYLAHARDLEPKNAQIHFLFGLTCNEMKVPIEARKSLEAALALEPENPYFNYALGAVLLQWAEKSQGIPYLKKFVTLQPDAPRGHLALATAYFTEDEFDLAKREALPLLRDPQTCAAAEYLLGRIAALQDDPDGAIGHFRKLVALEPKSAEGHAALGSALADKQDEKNARLETDLALTQDPDNYVANRTLLRLYKSAGDPRMKSQSERLRKLADKHEEQNKLLQRTIEVRAW